MSEEISQVSARFDALRARFDQLNSAAGLSELSSSVASLTRDIGTLPDEIAKIRQRGYVFGSYLEHKGDVLKQQWDELRDGVQHAIDADSERLRNEVSRLRRRVESATSLRTTSPAALVSQLPDLERGLAAAEAILNDAKTRIQGLFSTLQTDTSQTLNQLRQINGYLDERDEAKFPFLAEEAVFLVAKAEWVDGRDNPDGILYLTDQRLLFEQKEKTGKKLGLFGGKQTQELEWEIPLHQVDGVQAENKGFLGGKDLLNFALGSGAPYAALTVEVKGGVQSKFWAAQIQRMIKGETSDERAIQPDAETLEAIRNAPTACPSCGGTLPQLVAGQRQVECIYCGSVIRV